MVVLCCVEMAVDIKPAEAAAAVEMRESPLARACVKEKEVMGG